MKSRILLFLLLLSTSVASLGQSTQQLNDGKSFAESIVPTVKGQVVNPAGVGVAAWTTNGQSTNLPTVTPTGLGPFSAPVPTTSSLFDSTKALGALSGLGNAKIHTCQNLAPTGDPMLDQECVVVRFMNKDCVPMTVLQNKVHQATGINSGIGVNCQDSYGSGMTNFNFQTQITEQDPVFDAVRQAQATASQVTSQNCVPQQVVTSPAEYEINTCCKTALTDVKTCNKELNVTITTISKPAIVAYSCEGGVLVGQYCNSSTETAALITSYSCPPGYTITGNTCEMKTTTAATGSYSCPPGQVLEGTSCILTTTTAAGMAYQCLNGGVLQGTDCVTSATTDATSTYSCPVGTLVNGTQCLISTTTAASSSYSCPPGWDLNGPNCQKFTYSPPEVTYSCPPGGVLIGNQCQTTTTVPANPNYTCGVGTLQGVACFWTDRAPAQYTYYCPPGDTIVGATCYRTYQGTPADPYCTTGVLNVNNGLCTLTLHGRPQAGWNCTNFGEVYTCTRLAEYRSYTCPQGGTVSGSTCTMTSVASTQYTCTAGVLDGTECVTQQSGPATVTYTCTSGSLSGNSCIITGSGPAIPNYFCPGGGNLNGSTCEGLTVNPATVTYFCPDGGDLAGDQCVKQTIVSAILNYSCPNGGTLSGAQCIGTTINPATVYYFCPDGQTLQGQSCIATAISPAILNYSCPPGTTLFGLMCEGTSVIPATPNYSCLPGQVLNGTTCTLFESIPATPSYSCPGGIPPVGDQCISYTTAISWINGCLPFEQSSGVTPGDPP